MCGFLGSGQRGLYTRGSLATLFSCGVARRVRDDGGVVFARFFTGNVSELMTAKTPAEFSEILDWLKSPSYRSGSTNILNVIEVACADVQAAKDDLARTEILLITDCEDHFAAKDIKPLLKGAELNILDVAGGSIDGVTAKALKEVANKYFKANEAAANIHDIVKLI